MSISVRLLRGDPLSESTDLLAIGLPEGRRTMLPLLVAIDRALSGALRRGLDDMRHEGKLKQQLLLDTLGRLRARRVAVIGIGPAGERAAGMLYLAATAAKVGVRHGAATVIILAPGGGEQQDDAECLARGINLGTYRFDRYRTEKQPKIRLRQVSVGWLPASGRSPRPSRSTLRPGLVAGLHVGQVVAEAVSLARDLTNEPGIELYPETLARRAQREAKANGLAVKVLGPAELRRRGMSLLLGVGAGSARPPRLVHLTWAPRGARGRPIVLVGKGITFDSGGLSLKSASNMADMKVDMAGAAAVLATLLAAARLKLPLIVHGVLALAENMPSGTALRVGDVVRSAAGKTVEIINTDAEGRLVLADALHFAAGLAPRWVVDVATLTGACVVALGPQTAGLFSNDERLANDLSAAAAAVGESLWRLPLDKALREQIKSDIADLKNTGERGGGAITAALFLAEFAPRSPWAHLDIAGPAHASAEKGIIAKGATGFAVATLVELLRRQTGGVRGRG